MTLAVSPPDAARRFRRRGSMHSFPSPRRSPLSAPGELSLLLPPSYPLPVKAPGLPARLFWLA